ncbi:ATP-grasp ribosomal peptide maturase [Actinomadura meridiana]|uniref:ATP-grasp ribosomal peptide maturase n=1 Tax=Actinomadura meridiana TaxID=559626 RepID=A0ABP8CPS2_9ACTN
MGQRADIGRTGNHGEAVLVVTGLEDVTADLVIAALNDRQVPVVRVDPADIGSQKDALAFAADIGGESDRWEGLLRTGSRRLDLTQIRSIYHRRPGRWRFDHLEPRAREFAVREAQHGLAGLLAHLPVPQCNAPAATARADYKPAQLQAAAELGFSVPETLITNDLAAARAFAAKHAPVVYKTFRGVPPADGQAGAIWTQRIAPTDLDDSIAVTAHLFQAEIDKVADLRVTVVGRRVFATAITGPGNSLDWRSADWNQLNYEPYQLPDCLVPLLHAYLDHFGLAFGCFDLAVERDSGRIIWIECNPNGQWGFLPDSDAIAEAFAALLQAGWTP